MVSANAILLLIKEDFGLLQEGLINMAHELSLHFGDQIWHNVIIGVSFWKYDEYHISLRNKTCSETPALCHDEAWLTGEINRQLQEVISPDLALPAVFIDAWSQTPGEAEDATQQFYFQQETAKLWEFVQSQPELAFSTANDLRVENQRLKDDIESIKERLTLIEADVTQNTLTIDHVPFL